ncbi:MAG: hypothetical protein JRI25_09630 [Deltaproteobacteria bacterium]|nr:hypothetical protein [Deltaproteobacteria bacterium]
MHGWTLLIPMAALLGAGCTDYGLSPFSNTELPPGEEVVDTGVPLPEDTEEPLDTGDPPDPIDPVEDDFVGCDDVGLWQDQWWGSMPFDHPDDPTDGDGHPFYGWDHVMLDYSTVAVPDEGHVPSGTDRVYRVHLWLDAVGPRIFLDLQSDDGLWVYLNGDFIGHWGGNWQEEGCVNDLANCTQFVDIPPVEITSDVQVGDNLLAVRLSNAIDRAYMGLSPRCVDP